MTVAAVLDDQYSLGVHTESYGITNTLANRNRGNLAWPATRDPDLRGLDSYEQEWEQSSIRRSE